MQGRLRKNRIGRWEIVDLSGDSAELCAGAVVDVYRGDRGWIRTRIGHDGRDYVAQTGGELFDGILVRLVTTPRFNPG